MADRPAQICQLEKGKLIDTQQGFVDTFNWVAQSMANLDGGENCEVTWTLPDHPTIDVTESEDEDEGSVDAGVTSILGNADGSVTIDGALAFDKVNVSGKQSNVEIKTIAGENGRRTIEVGVYYV